MINSVLGKNLFDPTEKRLFSFRPDLSDLTTEQCAWKVVSHLSKLATAMNVASQ